jgi:uncharacterized UPF0160 family protein
MKKLTLVTHDGTFHTDDVFACAALSLVFKDQDIEIIRSRDERDIERGNIVFDVGGVYDPASGRFDHHQKGGAGARENGIPYASFGLVWKEYGHMVAGSVENAAFIDEQLVQGIDGADTGSVDKVADNGVYTYSIIDTIIAFRPTWQEKKSSFDAFLEAVAFARTVIVRLVDHAVAFRNAEQLLEDAYDRAPNKQIIEIGTEYPGWYEAMARHPEPLFVIYERSDGKWSAKTTRINPVEFAPRKAFPESWRGLRDQEFARVSGVSDAVFCHDGGFIAVARTKQGAYALAEKAAIT